MSRDVVLKGGRNALALWYGVAEVQGL